ncbi:TetR/AcrR family transcriptional regulator [Treponema parvum]|uniref:TetR/AcrR family transcriptional regulator n=1 Tax=Treponema parvum TaxID=138851 RepID=A0A975IFB1_9SPIR|nr:TetR/AcrR family transcriptional regulator [Treponema parvum]QTQ14940.1 TetR/AcrR family transcriptional regulator [Treponema parvum]
MAVKTACKSCQKRQSAKERILDIAFSFFKTPLYEQVSLNDIAKKAGISKAAIFRHFKNKADLVCAMQNRFFNDVADYIISIKQDLTAAIWSKDVSLYRIVLRNTVKTYFEYPEYLFYMLSHSAVSIKDYREQTLLLSKKLEEKGLSLKMLGGMFGVNYSPENFSVFNLKNYAAISYAFISVAYFLILSLSGQKKSSASDQAESGCLEKYVLQEPAFDSETIADLLDFGIYSPQRYLSYERMKELDEKAHIDLSKIPPANKIFCALSQVIDKYGFPGVTVKRLADTLNMAKSSLYSYFDSKKTLIHKLLTEEIYLMISSLDEVCGEITDSTELAYVFFRALTEYFLARQDILTVFRWTRMSGSIIPEQYEHEDFSLQNFKLSADVDEAEQLDKLPFKMTRRIFFTWISVVSSSIVMRKNIHNLSDENCYEIVKLCFDFMQRGLTSDTN